MSVQLPLSPGPLPKLPLCEAICRIKDPLTYTPEKTQLMVDACRELAEYYLTASPEIRALYARHGFEPALLRTEADLARIPSLMVSAMKSFLITSLPHEQSVLRLTSSGTRGQKTQIWFDSDSLDRVQAQLWELWLQEGLIGTVPTNYVLFVYDPSEAKDLGIAFTDENAKRFAPEHRSFHTVRKDAHGAWEFRIDQTIETFREFISEGKPIRIFGIPSFLHDFIEELIRRDLRLSCPPGSMVMTGGGWKAAEDKQITREEFRNRLVDRLGLKIERVRDGYGMAEHSAPYMECRKHRFHIPVYNRLIIRDPSTMAALPPGEVGLLELVTPFNAMIPNLAVLSTDLAMIDPEPCGCGWNAPTFTLLGRGGLVKHKGCAIHASEITRRAAASASERKPS